MSLPYREFLLRLLKLAKIALREYGLEQAKIKFINYSGNGVYQITVPSSCPIAPGKYALRIHQPDYMKPQFIISEMEWLSALYQERIPVPKPVRNLQGDWLTKAEGSFAVPQQRNCTLIGWIEGRLLNKSIRPTHCRALGKVIGRMHEQSKNWKLPNGFARPHWDWNGLFGDGFSYGVPAADARHSIPDVHQIAFNDVLNRVNEVSVQLGKSKSVYGLIHADLGLGDNVAFSNGEARPFDFDDCGFGYWLFDFGVVLAHHFIDTDSLNQTLRDGMISGYEETANLDNIDIEYLDIFIAARIAQIMFFYQANGLANPEYMDRARRDIDNHAKYLKHILKIIKRK